MKGQISIDYVAGAMAFFGAIIFLVSTVLGALPGITQAQAVNELELAGWSTSEVLVKDQGTPWDWETLADPGSNPSVTVIGLQGNGSGISTDKIHALQDMSYPALRGKLDVNNDISLQFTEYVIIDTYHRFDVGSPPPFITPPPSASDIVHYGSKRLNGSTYYFLLDNESSFYNRLNISRDWDFTTSEVNGTNLETDSFLLLQDNVYTAEAAHTEISDGNTLILQRGLGRAGSIPPAETANIIRNTRYAASGDSIIEVTTLTW